jgi:hypothetical protein
VHRFTVEHAADAGGGAELRTVDSDPLAADQANRACELDQFCTRCRHCIAVRSPELGNGLVVRIQTLQQPHQLHIAVALCLQPPRGAHLMQISIQIQLQQIARIVTRTPGRCGFGSREPKLFHLQPVDECVDHTAHMLVWHQIVQHCWKQRPLTPPLASDIAHKEKCPRSRKHP